MLRPVLLLSVLAAGLAAAEVSPAVDLAADMVESRIVEGHPSARWLRSVADGLRSGRITIQEASALLAMINHQAAFTATPVLRSAPALPSEPRAPSAPEGPRGDAVAAQSAVTAPDAKPSAALEAESERRADAVAAAPADPTAEDVALEALAELEAAVEAVEAIEAATETAEAAETLEVAEEGGAGGLLELPPVPAAPSSPGAEAEEPGTGVAGAEPVPSSPVDQAVDEPDLEGAIQALSRREGRARDVFASVDTGIDEDTEDARTAVADDADPATDDADPATPNEAVEPALDDDEASEAMVEAVPAVPPTPTTTGSEPEPESSPTTGATAPAVAEAETTSDAAHTRALAKVVHVKLATGPDEPELVMLEGTRLRKGQTLAIHRSGHEVVRLLILRVEGTLAMAMVLGASWQPEAQRPTAVGDRAYPLEG